MIPVLPLALAGGALLLLKKRAVAAKPPAEQNVADILRDLAGTKIEEAVGDLPVVKEIIAFAEPIMEIQQAAAADERVVLNRLLASMSSRQRKAYDDLMFSETMGVGVFGQVTEQFFWRLHTPTMRANYRIERAQRILATVGA